MSAARIPRLRHSILPKWTDLSPLTRIVVGVAIGLMALSAIGGAL